MKQTCFLFLLFYAKAIIAQENQDVYVATKNRSLYSGSSQQAETNVKGYVNYVNSRAARHLFKNFGDAPIVHWVIDDESTAYFTRGGEFIKVRYDKDGGYISTRKIYAGNKLDRYVAYLAKKDLDKDFSIYGVTEMSTDNGKIYEVILQNKIYWSVARIAEDNMGYLARVGENEVFLKM